MLGNLMIAIMATGLAGGPSCANDVQSARAISVDPLEVSATGSNARIDTVEVLASINADGRIDEVTVLGPAGSDRIQHAVEKASSRWRFEPAQACGQAVAQAVSFALPVLPTRFLEVQNAGAPGPASDLPRSDKAHARMEPWEAY